MNKIKVTPLPNPKTAKEKAIIPKPFRKAIVLPKSDGRLTIWFADAETKTRVMSSLPAACAVEKLDLGLKVVITVNPCFVAEEIARAILHLAGEGIPKDNKISTNPNQMDWVEETGC